MDKFLESCMKIHGGLWVEKNKSLQSLNTMAVPSRAEYFVEVKNLEQIRAAIHWAKEQQLQVHILGGGSNVILADVVEGLVLHPDLDGKECCGRDSEKVFVRANAGECWHDLVLYCHAQGWYGLENLALIPGNVGAAPIQNIGAYGVELQDVFYSLEALNIETLELEVFDKDACHFAYRESIFKQMFEGRYLILSVTLCLSLTPHVNVVYPALGDMLKSRGVEKPTPKDLLDSVIQLRTEKLPDPAVLPNSGSFFKNPVISLSECERLLEAFPAMVNFETASGERKLAAAWLIDQAGWKGRLVDEVRVHEKQALVVTNPQKKSSTSVLALAKAIQGDVQQKFGVILEMEPRIMGEVK